LYPTATPLPPCDPAVSACPEATGTPPPFPSPTPCQVGCLDGTPTPTPLAVPGNFVSYTVQSGDTCPGIGASFGLSVDALEALNPGLDCAHLVAGQVLLVPVTLTPTPPPPAAPGQPFIYTIQPGDTCQGIAANFGVPLDVILVANGLSDCTALTVGQSLIIPLAPVPSPTPCQAGCPGTPMPTVPPRPT
jgi:LysM repeat protein